MTENLLTGLVINVFTLRGVLYQGDEKSLLLPRSREWHPRKREYETRWYTERMEETFNLAEDVRLMSTDLKPTHMHFEKLSFSKVACFAS